MDAYRITYTIEAHEVLQQLPPHRRALLDRGLRVLARDPYLKSATAQIGPNEQDRKAYVGPGLVIEYMVRHGVMVVVVVEIFDESAYLIDEADDA